MVLAIDVGNTNIIVAGYLSSCFLFSFKIPSTGLRTQAFYEEKLREAISPSLLKTEKIEGAILASVVPEINVPFCAAMQTVCKVLPILFGPDLCTDIAVDIDDPSELGADILASAVTVCAEYALPAIIIDLGTAITITAITSARRIAGVAILPGMRISLEALVGNTALLKSVVLEAPAHAIGRNTIDSIKSGMVFGTASMLEGMIARFEYELGEKATVLSTGGAGAVVSAVCRPSIPYHPNLLLDGLYIAYQNYKTK